MVKAKMAAPPIDRLRPVLSYIKETPENTNRMMLYEYDNWLNNHTADYIMKAPENVNPRVLETLYFGDSPSTKARSVAEINEAALTEGAKVVVRDKILMDDTIEVYGEKSNARIGISDLEFRNSGTLKATKDCDWFMFIARKEAFVNLDGSGLMTSNRTKAIPVTAASGSVISIYGGNYRCSYEAGECVYADNARANIYGGTFGMDEGEPIHPLLNVKNGQDVSQIRVYGGRFIGWDPATGDDAMGGNFVADGYESVEVEPGIWEVRYRSEI